MKTLKLAFICLLISQAGFAKDPSDEQDKSLDSANIVLEQLKKGMVLGTNAPQVQDSKKISDKTRFQSSGNPVLGFQNKPPVEDEGKAPKDDQSLIGGGTSR